VSRQRHQAAAADGLHEIAFATNRDGFSEVYSMDAGDGGNQTNLTFANDIDSAPAWSPRP
jgi:Tol biopolymer transport system component